MVIKHYDPKNGQIFLTADEIATHTISGIGLYENFNQLLYKDAEELYCAQYNHILEKIQKITGWKDRKVNFYMNTPFEKIGTFIVIYPKTKNKEQDIWVFNEYVYLMTDEGKTIEKLI